MANKKVWLEGYWFYWSLKKTAIDFIYFIIFFCFYFSVLLKKYFYLFKNYGHHFVDKGPYSQSYGFSSSDVQMWVKAKELMLSNCGAGEDPWESLGLQGDQTSQS